MDLIVMVDTSESMFPFFDDLVEYLIRDLLEQNLYSGDSFRLLSFADRPEIELELEVDGNFKAEEVIERILLLQPFGAYTDLVSAVQFLYATTKSLPEKNQKTILLLTDGVHDPPPGTPYAGWDAERVRQELLSSAREIRREGWSVHIMQIPGLAPAGAVAALADPPAGGAEPDAAGGRASGIRVPADADRATPADRSTPAGSVPAGSVPAGSTPAGSTSADRSTSTDRRISVDGRTPSERSAPVAGREAPSPGRAADLQAPGAGRAPAADGVTRVGVVPPGRGDSPSPPAAGSGRSAGEGGVSSLGDGRVSPPGDGDASSPGDGGVSPLLNTMAGELGTRVVPYQAERKEEASSLVMGFPQLRFPGPLGKVGRSFNAPFTVYNFRNEPIILHLNGVITDVGSGEWLDLLARNTTVTVPAGGDVAFRVPLRLPADFLPGPRRLEVEVKLLDETTRISPKRGILEFSYSPSLARTLMSNPRLLLYLLYAVLAAAAIWLLLKLVRSISLRIEDLPAAPFRRALSAIDFNDETRPLIMSIYFRDYPMADKTIHRIPPGSSGSVGGVGSTFPVRMVPLPRRVADICNDRSGYVLQPRRPEFLPGGAEPIVDCLNRPIEMGREEGRRVKLIFREYVSPLEEINRLMLSIRNPVAAAPPAAEGKPPTSDRA